jgi:ubiquinone/menaquinone biosynthesis C-methylase UbiE
MALTVDPQGLETRAMHDLIDFRDKDVLEIGCGDGRVTWRYAADAATVTAIDPDVAMIEAAEDALPEGLRSGVSFRVADVSSVDLPDSGYDVAVFSGSL